MSDTAANTGNCANRTTATPGNNIAVAGIVNADNITNSAASAAPNCQPIMTSAKIGTAVNTGIAAPECMEVDYATITTSKCNTDNVTVNSVPTTTATSTTESAMVSSGSVTTVSNVENVAKRSGNCSDTRAQQQEDIEAVDQQLKQAADNRGEKNTAELMAAIETTAHSDDINIATTISNSTSATSSGISRCQTSATLSSTNAISTSESAEVINSISSCAIDSVVIENEYITQFLGFTPKAFTDTMYNVVLQSTWNALQGVQDCLQKEFPSQADSMTTDAAMHKTWPVVQAVIDKSFDKLEAYVEQTMSVPQHVVLPEDSCHQQGYSTLGKRLLEQQITDVQNTITKASVREAVMKNEIQVLEEVLKTCEKTEKFHDSLKTHLGTEQDKTLTDLLDSLDKQQESLHTTAQRLPDIAPKR